MKLKILIIATSLILTSCYGQNNILKLDVDCDNKISINGKNLDSIQVSKKIKNHIQKYKSKADFKITACKETSVKKIVGLRTVINQNKKIINE